MQSNGSVVMKIFTYENLWERGEDVIWFVEQGYRRILERLPHQAEAVYLEGYPIGGVRNRLFVFNEKNWTRFRKELLEGILEIFCLTFWVRQEEGVGAQISMYTYPDSPGEASALTIRVERSLYEGPLGRWQGEWVDLACETFVRFDGATGYLICWATPESTYLAHSRIGYEIYRELRSKVNGYYWGNLLSRGHIERLGGLGTVFREAPCYLVRDLSRGEDWRVYLQLTADMEDTPVKDLRALRDYLRPLLPERETPLR